MTTNRTHQEQTSLHRVRDPHLGAGDGVVAAVLTLGRGRLERERVGAGRWLGEGEASNLQFPPPSVVIFVVNCPRKETHRVGREPREVLVLDRGRRVLSQDRVDQRVVDVAQNRNRRVNLCQF